PLNRRSTIRQGISPVRTTADSRNSSRERQHRKELAAGKLDRAVFKKRRCSTHRSQMWTGGKRFLPSRHFRRGRQNRSGCVGARMEKSRGPFRKQFTAASSGRGA